ncbi:MAG: hypothetical protein IAI48_18595 [Candidatus Eremiobacteraeota bacterium]|nr:hypothetical protein [Candidatus Eremiobacteraeota bacterium]
MQQRHHLLRAYGWADSGRTLPEMVPGDRSVVPADAAPAIVEEASR